MLCAHGLVISLSDFIQTKSMNCEPLCDPSGSVIAQSLLLSSPSSYLEHGMVSASLNEPRWRTLVNHRYPH